MNLLRESIALIHGVAGNIDWLSESHGDFSRTDHEGLFLHDAMGSGTGDRHDWDACFNRHDERAFLEAVQAAVGTARPLGIDQKRRSGLDIFDGLLDAGESGVAI